MGLFAFCLLAPPPPLLLFFMGFQRLVEVGRVALINYGDLAGKLCVIIDVLDYNRVFIDGPSSLNGVQRQVFPVKRLQLTDIKIKMPRRPSCPPWSRRSTTPRSRSSGRSPPGPRS